MIILGVNIHISGALQKQKVDCVCKLAPEHLFLLRVQFAFMYCPLL